MKNIWALFIQFLLLSALSTLATVSAYADCSSGCNQQSPVPVNVDSDGFSLQEAQSLYLQGVVPTQAQLQGTWMQVGTATLPNEPDPSMHDVYNSSGITNTDGSSTDQLQFQALGAGQKDFAGKPMPEVFSVTMENLGSRAGQQGPNKVDLTSHGACFAKYGYDQYGSLLKSHENSSCLLLKQDSSKLLCAVTLVIDPSEATAIAPAITSWNGKIEFYQAYVKVN
jgi:hypothetical protein